MKQLKIMKQLDTKLNCKLRIRYAFLLSIILQISLNPNVVVSQSNIIQLEDIMNSDGTINTSVGYSGSVDPAGWDMILSPNGEPVFKKSVSKSDQFIGGESNNPDDVYWSDIFGSYGISSSVFAMAAFDNEIYIGGDFQSVAGLRANQIVKWDGISWDTLSSELKAFDINSIAVQGSNIYVAGMIYEPEEIHGIACWNGSAWLPLGEGINGSVSAIAVDDSDIYVGGFFGSAGNINAKSIARWDGNTWHDVGGGVNGTISAIAILDNDIYVGGILIVQEPSTQTILPNGMVTIGHH